MTTKHKNQKRGHHKSQAKDKNESLFFVHEPVIARTTAILGCITYIPYTPPFSFEAYKALQTNNIRNANTNTSVVAAIFREIDDPEYPPYLVAYHNVYAKIELNSEILAKIGVRQFTLNEDTEGKYQECVEISK